MKSHRLRRLGQQTADFDLNLQVTQFDSLLAAGRLDIRQLVLGGKFTIDQLSKEPKNNPLPSLRNTKALSRTVRMAHHNVGPTDDGRAVPLRVAIFKLWQYARQFPPRKGPIDIRQVRVASTSY
jgi:hypothetical protein